MEVPIAIIAATSLVSLAIGIFLSRTILRKALLKKSQQILKEAESEAEVIKKEKVLQAKEKFLQLKSEHEKYVAEKNKEISAAENKIKQKEDALQKRTEELKKKQSEVDTIKENLNNQLEIVNRKQEEVEKAHAKHLQQLETISSMSAEEAKGQLLEALKADAQSEANTFLKEYMDEAKVTANMEAKKLVIHALQRTATEVATENSVSVFPIENDELKGRIIGREGRNIRALEAATGVEIIVDDTPEAIILSGFDPVRREIARLSMHKLITDGRIHPARIEEVVGKVKKQIDQEIIDIGKRTSIDMGIHNIHHELMRLIGKMKYRSSYGQNLLQHSKEVANLAAAMAAELGLNPKIAKRAGLLHDIGKVPDNEPELPHAMLGMKLAEKYKENQEICNAIGSHHEETEMKSLISPIIQVCDSISGSRPGARREVVESYIKRLKDLEELALTYPGVVKTYAVQAGRELRVIVGSEKISDQEAEEISSNLSKKIQNEMTYPGQIKITVIRETRSVAYAK